MSNIKLPVERFLTHLDHQANGGTAKELAFDLDVDVSLIYNRTRELMKDGKVVKSADVYFTIKNHENYVYGDNIRELRQKKGLTLQGLADATGFSKSLVSNAENDYKVNAEKKQKILDFLRG